MAEFFNLAGPGMALALKFRQQGGREGKEDRRDHVWKKKDGIALLHLTRQTIGIFFFSQCNYSAVLSGIAYVVVPLAHTLLWMDGWMKRRREEMGEKRYKTV